MSGIFDMKSRGPGLAEGVLRTLLSGVIWTLLCLSLGDVIPQGWALLGLPLALGAGWLLGFSGLALLPASMLLVLFPLIPLAAATVFGRRLGFDNGWLLTFPLWYFAGFFALFGVRRSGAAKAEVAVSLLFTGILLSRDDDFGLLLTSPALETLKLSLAAASLLIAALALAAIERRAYRRDHRRLLRFSADRAIHTVLLLGALFLLLYGGNRLRREESLQSGGGLLASDLFRFDFSDVLSLEPEISLNAELTMLYREDGRPVPRYLRRYTLSGWNEEGGFYRDAEAEGDVPGAPARPAFLPKAPIELESAGFLDREQVRQEYYLVALDPESFFALDSPTFIEPWNLWDDASFTRAYAVESAVSVAGPWELIDAEAGEIDKSLEAYYLRGGDDENILRLAREAAEDAEGAWEIAAALERWFHNEFYYSLRPGMAPDGDQLSWFLEETRRGYCSYFAFAMAQMCRSLGIPARVAVGFLSDPQGSTLGFVPVRADQAHAWVEVWVGEYGWITFDPTSQTMAPGEEYPLAFVDPEQWLPLVEEVLTRSGEISISLADEALTEEDAWWHSAVSLLRRRRQWGWGAALLLILCAYWPGRIRPALSNFRLLRSSRPSDRAKGAWRRFAGSLIRSGFTVLPGETPSEWAGRANSVGISEFSQWTGLYLKTVFSEVFGNEDEAAANDAAVLSRNGWKSLPLRKRLWGALSPAWRRRLPW